MRSHLISLEIKTHRFLKVYLPLPRLGILCACINAIGYSDKLLALGKTHCLGTVEFTSPVVQIIKIITEATNKHWFFTQFI